MAERDLQQDKVRGIHAERELEETAFAFKAVREAILEEIAKCPVGQDSKILKLHQSLQNLAAVRQALMNTIASGKHAEATMAARDAIAVEGLTRP